MSSQTGWYTFAALPPARSYYAYWERRLFAAVSSMVVSGLQAFHARLAACTPVGQAANTGMPRQVEAGEDGDGSHLGKPPLFRVRAAEARLSWFWFGTCLA